MKRWLWVLLLLATPAAAQEPSLDQWCRKHEIAYVSEPKNLYPLKTHYGPITGTAASEKIRRTYEPLCAVELAKYPGSFVKKLSLAKIVLAEELKFDGQKRAAIPDFEHEILHLDPREGNYSKLYQQTVIHHELFHIVDWKDDGELYEDLAWKKLNPEGFKYGNGGKNARGNDQWALDDSLVGFLNKYSMSGVEEDKAEIFANLMVRPAVVHARAARDKILAKKVERMKKLLFEFCPDLDEKYWKAHEK